MTSPGRRATTRPKAALIGAAITLVALRVITPAFAQSTDPPPPDPTWDGTWTTPNADRQTIADGVFSGTFTHGGTVNGIAKAELAFPNPKPDLANCPGPVTPPPQTTPSTTPPTPPQTDSTMAFDFEVTFPCNGVYDATATATLDDPLGQQYSIELKSINVAVPPQQPVSFLATDTGNHTVELSWTGPNDSPPDLAGYRLSRRDATGATFGVLGTTTPSVFAFTDSNIPATGGSYFYRIETMRTAPGGTQLASVPVTTGQALVVDATPGSVPGNSGGGGGGSTPADGAPATAPTGGDQHFDETTLAADEGEPGANDPVAALPGGDTIQRFAGHDGAGLVKPFAAALDIAVWAGLLLFLTRRAAGAERAAALVVELEHPT